MGLAYCFKNSRMRCVSAGANIFNRPHQFMLMHPQAAQAFLCDLLLLVWRYRKPSSARCKKSSERNRAVPWMCSTSHLIARREQDGRFTITDCDLARGFWVGSKPTLTIHRRATGKLCWEWKRCTAIAPN
jgi:hypothetical protein